MEQNTEQKKETYTKTLAIAGVVALLILGSWLAVKAIALVPSAFSSLASLADGVNEYQTAEAITVSVGETVVANGEDLTVSWTGSNQEGTYYFSYDCIDGVSLAMKNGANTSYLSCDEQVPVSGNVLTLEASSEKNRFTDIPVKIDFVSEDDIASVSSDNTITVVNAGIGADPVEEIILTDVITETESEPDPEVAVDPTPTPEVSTLLPPAPKPDPVIEYTYQIPENDPNGFTDLAVRFIGVGYLNNNKVFVPVSEIDNDFTGAFQFEVKNIGTKTSGDWSFDSELPNGVDYTSKTLAPLRPNERSVFTIGFSLEGTTGINVFNVDVDHNEANKTNNKLTWAVTVNN